MNIAARAALALSVCALMGAFSFGSLRVLAANNVAPKRTLTVSSFGAVGDGKTDDTAALQRAFDTLRAGDRLVFAAGKTYRHSDVLAVKKSGVRLSGAATLLATNEERSSFLIDADNVTLDGGLVFKMAATTKRWEAHEQMKVRLAPRSGIVLRDITVDGSAAAGVFIGGASNYLLENVTVQNTRADGIHNTAGAHDGMIRRATVRNVGDDGVAIVSYENKNDAVPCRKITVESPRFYGNVWGRGLSVVGGEDITFLDVYVEKSNAAAIYIANEGAPYFTFAAKRVRVLGGTIKNANFGTVDHGAVLIVSGRDGYSNDDIEIADLNIIETRATASRQVGILGEAKRVQLRNFAITGGPENLLAVQVPLDHYNVSGWTRIAPVPDHIGFTP